MKLLEIRHNGEVLLIPEDADCVGVEDGVVMFGSEPIMEVIDDELRYIAQVVSFRLEQLADEVQDEYAGKTANINLPPEERRECIRRHLSFYFAARKWRDLVKGKKGKESRIYYEGHHLDILKASSEAREMSPEEVEMCKDDHDEVGMESEDDGFNSSPGIRRDW